MDVFERLYASEINWSVSTFWDAGYDVKLGDELNGYRFEGHAYTWAEVVSLLEQQAKLHWPLFATEGDA